MTDDVLKLSGKMRVAELEPRETLLQVLMRRDELTAADARELIDEARERILAGEDPQDVLAEEFGLEPDYIMDLF